MSGLERCLTLPLCQPNDLDRLNTSVRAKDIPRIPTAVLGAGRSRAGGRLNVDVAGLEKAGLDKQVPDAARLLHVDLNEVARRQSFTFTSARDLLDDEGECAAASTPSAPRA